MHEYISVILFLVVIVNQMDHNNETVDVLSERLTPASGVSI